MLSINCLYDIQRKGGFKIQDLKIQDFFNKNYMAAHKAELRRLYKYNLKL